MKHSNSFRSIITLGLVLASTAFITACDADDGAETPHQYVDEKVDHVEFELIIGAAELQDDMGVADFLVYKVDDSHEEYDSLSSQCTADPEGYFETSCGGCVCLSDGSVLCVDYSCEDIFGSITFPQTSAETDPPGPGHDGRFATPPTNPSFPPGGPGTQFGDLQSPRPPAYPLNDAVSGPGTDFNTLTPPPVAESDEGLLLDQYTESPAFCRDGHAVGALWQEGVNSCICTEDRIVACTLIGNPLPPDSWG